MFVCREAERLPYGRTGGWADSPWGGALEKDDYPSVSFADSSPDKGSLGALPRQCGSGMK